jgi:hypothetical protein
MFHADNLIKSWPYMCSFIPNTSQVYGPQLIPCFEQCLKVNKIVNGTYTFEGMYAPIIYTVSGDSFTTATGMSYMGSRN